MVFEAKTAAVITPFAGLEFLYEIQRLPGLLIDKRLDFVGQEHVKPLDPLRNIGEGKDLDGLCIARHRIQSWIQKQPTRIRCADRHGLLLHPTFLRHTPSVRPMLLQVLWSNDARIEPGVRSTFGTPVFPNPIKAVESLNGSTMQVTRSVSDVAPGGGRTGF